MIRLWAFLLCACVALLARSSYADPAGPKAETADAQKLFDEAKELIFQGKWEAACPKLVASNRAEARHTTLYRLAECYEHVGRPASAWAAYRAAAKVARAAGEGTRADFATARAARLEPTLSYVLVTVRDPPPGLKVEWDGASVRESEWNIRVPVDPGQHVIGARAPWKLPYSAKVDVPADRSTVVVLLPQLETEQAGPMVAAHLPTGILSQQIESDDAKPLREQPVVDKKPPPTNTVRWLRPWGFGIGGLGLSAAGLGTFLILNDKTDSSGCTGQCLSGAVLLASGGAVLALGVALVLATLGD